MKERGVVSVVLYSIFTFGIYALYWYYVTTEEIQKTLKNPDGSCKSGAATVFLSVITFGIYTIYWFYKQSLRIAEIQKETSVPASGENGLVWLILTICGLSVIAMALMQSELNKIAAAKKLPAE